MGQPGQSGKLAPPPPVNKNLPHTWTSMRQQRYGGKAEMWSVRAMHTFSCPEISSAMLQCYVLTCGRAGGDRLFGAPSKSAPGARAPLAPPKGRPWVRSTEHKDPGYVIFPTPLSPCPSYVEVPSSSPYARIPLACMFVPQCERPSLTPMQNNRKT
jgi:hypothetical protein